MEIKIRTYIIYGEKASYGSFAPISPDQCREWYKNSIMDGTIKISVSEVDGDDTTPSFTTIPQELADAFEQLPIIDLVNLLRDAVNTRDEVFREYVIGVIKERTRRIT